MCLCHCVSFLHVGRYRYNDIFAVYMSSSHTHRMDIDFRNELKKIYASLDCNTNWNSDALSKLTASKFNSQANNYLFKNVKKNQHKYKSTIISTIQMELTFDEIQIENSRSKYILPLIYKLYWPQTIDRKEAIHSVLRRLKSTTDSFQLQCFFEKIALEDSLTWGLFMFIET